MDPQSIDLNEKVLCVEYINLNSINDNKHIERSNLTVEVAW